MSLLGAIGGGVAGLGFGPVGILGGGMIGNQLTGGMGGAGDDGYQYLARPQRPGFEASYDPRTMSMLPGLEGKLAGIEENRAGMNKYRQEALRGGPSAWAGLAGQQQDQMLQNARNQAAQGAAGQTAGAQSALAMRGGINSGARERLQTAGMRNQMDAGQNALQAANANKMQIGINDEQNRINQLGQLPGLENTANQTAFNKANLWGQGKQFDVGNAVHQGDTKNAFNMNNYNADMSAWGANQQANATAQAGKKGGLFGMGFGPF